jgi:lysophospholipase L1-like esterase
MNNTRNSSVSAFINYNGPSIDDKLKNSLQGSNPIKFHMNVPPGNYDVTVELGDPSESGSTSVQGEARRAMLGEISTPAGSILRQTFTVNVRNPEAQPTGEGGSGTSGLNLTFLGKSPKVNGIGVVPAKNPIMVYIAGDSTVCDRLSAPYAGWGEVLPQYFKFQTCIANYADCGEGSASFLNKYALFPTMKQIIKANDYVFIQFGHNDKTTTVDEYKNNLNRYITDIRKVGAIPILVTPPVRREFNRDKKTLSSTSIHINSIGVDLPAAMKEVAAKNNVPLIDLTSKSKALVESLGVEGCKKLYLTKKKDGVEDRTHFSDEYGANEMTKFIVEGIKGLNIPLASNIR